MAVRKSVRLTEARRLEALDLMTAIMGYTELLRREGSTAAEWEAHLAIVEESARSLSRLLFGSVSTGQRAKRASARRQTGT